MLEPCIQDTVFHATYKLAQSSCAWFGQTQWQNVDDPLLIDFKFLEDEQDLQDMVDGFKVTQKLMQAPALSEKLKKICLLQTYNLMMRFVRFYVNVLTRCITQLVVAKWVYDGCG